MMSCGSGWRLWKGSLLCLRERCYNGSEKHPLITSLLFWQSTCRDARHGCQLWPPAEPLQWKFTRRLYSAGLLLLQFKAAPKRVASFSRAAHVRGHRNIRWSIIIWIILMHFPLICQHSLPQTGEDSLSTFFLICNLNQLCRTSLSKTGIFLKISHVTAASCCWNIKYAEQLRSTSMFPAVSMCEEWCVKPTSSCVWTVTLITVGTVSDSFTRSVSAVDCRDGQHVSASSHCTKMNLRSLSDRVCAALIRRWSHSMEVLCTHSITNRPATTNLPQ